jgi:hypothetical protein
MKITVAFTFCLLIFFNPGISGQNLIGYNEKEILKYMKDKQRNMNFQKFNNNSTFKYLKFVDNNESQTLLFFLTSDSVCKAIRLICDKNLKAEKIREFDNIYTKAGVGVWTETRKGKKYTIELKDEDLSLTINIRANE